MGVGWLTYLHSLVSTPWPVPNVLRDRILFDAVGIYACGVLGFRLLLSFVTREGLDNIRMQTELSLAHGIQATLVPDLSLRTPRFEVYGKSVPSTEMGGDLIDFIENDDGSLLAYIADISGHGLAAGQLMGMLKASLRVSLQSHQQPAALLESADRVLPAVKTADMYATLALLRFNGSTHAEYSLAGHVPILHYRRQTSDTTRLSMEQLPLGLIPGGHYASQSVSYSPGDTFLLITDGITEVVNERDEEFGLARLERLLSQHAAQPLSEIWETVMEEVSRYGAQQDDQSLLLLRVRQ
jgi:sigma-B regulation protein RsbU (phosphoserine phosphatase)